MADFNQAVSGGLAPVGEITEIRIAADNPQGFIFPSGALETLLGITPQLFDGTITPSGSLFMGVLDVQCFPTDFACVGAEPVDFNCVGACESNEVAPPPDECPECPDCPECPECEECVDCPDCPECPPVTCCLLCGEVTPEGAVAGDVGCIYQWTAADESALDHAIWAKVAGAAETGWSPMYGLRGADTDSLRVGPLADAQTVDSIAIGHGPSARGLRAIVMGRDSIGYSQEVVVIGDSSVDNDTGPFKANASVVIGRQCAAGSYGNVVIGDMSVIDHNSFEGWDLGYIADETAYNSIAIGFGALVFDAQSIAIGDSAEVDGTCSEAIGLEAHCFHSLSVALGSQSKAFQENCIAIGFSAEAGWTDTGDPNTHWAVAIGYDSGAFAESSIALGPSANVSGSGAPGSSQASSKDSIAIGNGSNIFDSLRSVAIGAGAKVQTSRNYSWALGYFAYASAVQQLMIGGNDASGFFKEVRFNNGPSGSPARCPNIVMGNAALATSAVDGFPYIPTCSGAPVGVPTAYTGTVPLIYDTANNKLYAYNGGWKAVTLS